jgi:hypothetical protein
VSANPDLLLDKLAQQVLVGPAQDIWFSILQTQPVAADYLDQACQMFLIQSALSALALIFSPTALGKDHQRILNMLGIKKAAMPRVV